MPEPSEPAGSIFTTEAGRRWLETEVLPAYLQRSRWFGGKARGVQRVSIEEVIPFGGGAGLVFVAVHYASGEPDRYQLPLLHTSRSYAAGLLAREPSAFIAEDGDMALVDALHCAEFCAGLWNRLTPRRDIARGVRVLSVEQSNSSLIYGERTFVKVFRRLQPGVNPDAEILRFLTEERKFPHVPAFVSAFEWPAAGGESTLLAIATAVVPNHGDAWTFAFAELKAFHARTGHSAPRDSAHLRSTVGEEILTRFAQLGARTGALHVALAGPTTNPDFAPEPLATADFVKLRENVLSLWKEVTAAVPAERAAMFAAVTPRVQERARELTTTPIAATKTRTHGDYHLGQVLETGGDFVIIDFEGEPARPLAERRRKQSPVRDVAGMLRSLHYAAHASRGDDSEWAMVWAEAWSALTERAFLDAWCTATAGASFRPASAADLDFLLRAFLLEKAIYEIRYELNNRPTWLHIPLRGLERVLAAG